MRDDDAPAAGVIHGAGTGEFALCGLACDAFDSGDWHEPVAFALPGELVTCRECRAQLDHMRQAFRRYRAC